jgi:predicted transcriptional regulator
MPSGPDDLVERLMHRDVVSADHGASLRELAEIMCGEELGSVVITESGRVAGIWVGTRRRAGVSMRALPESGRPSSRGSSAGQN